MTKPTIITPGEIMLDANGRICGLFNWTLEYRDCVPSRAQPGLQWGYTVAELVAVATKVSYAT